MRLSVFYTNINHFASIIWRVVEPEPEREREKVCMV
jgi:hypothetical protein